MALEPRRLAKIVLYKISENDCLTIAGMSGLNNRPRPGDRLPMLITRDWGGDLVNGTVFLDGKDTLWKTSVGEGVDPGQYDLIHSTSKDLFD